MMIHRESSAVFLQLASLIFPSSEQQFVQMCCTTRGPRRPLLVTLVPTAISTFCVVNTLIAQILHKQKSSYLFQMREILFSLEEMYDLILSPLLIKSFPSQ